MPAATAFDVWGSGAIIAAVVAGFVAERRWQSSELSVHRQNARTTRSRPSEPVKYQK